MSLSVYGEYKESGSDWLGEIPSHWEARPLKFLGKAIIGLTYSPDDLAEPGEGVAVLRSTNVQNGRIDLKSVVFVNQAIPDQLMLRSNDVLICSRNGSRELIGKNALVSEQQEGMSFGAFMTVFRSPFNSFLFFIFNSQIFKAQSGLFITSTVNQLTTGTLNSFVVPVPPEDEQNAIARFLHHETAKIDALIQEQERLIELLQEKRQAVISHAVTKGLDPDVPMKDSGAEWLGKVPAHWDIRKVSYDFTAVKGPRGAILTKDYCAANPGPYPVYSGQTHNAGVLGSIEDFDFSLGSNGGLLTTTVGAKAMSLNFVTGKVSLSQNCMLIRPLSKQTFVKFHFYHLQPLFRLERGMIPDHMQPSFRMEDLYKFFVAQPPVEEQEAISRYLDHEMGRFDALAKESILLIERLKERRSALISVAVTGKIDVRNWKPPADESAFDEEVRQAGLEATA